MLLNDVLQDVYQITLYMSNLPAAIVIWVVSVVKNYSTELEAIVK